MTTLSAVWQIEVSANKLQEVRLIKKSNKQLVQNINRWYIIMHHFNFCRKWFILLQLILSAPSPSMFKSAPTHTKTMLIILPYVFCNSFCLFDYKATRKKSSYTFYIYIHQIYIWIQSCCYESLCFKLFRFIYVSCCFFFSFQNHSSIAQCYLFLRLSLLNMQY